MVICATRYEVGGLRNRFRVVNGKAIAGESVRGGAVWQCAPCVRTKGRAVLTHLAKRFQKRSGHWNGM